MRKRGVPAVVAGLGAATVLVLTGCGSSATGDHGTSGANQPTAAGTNSRSGQPDNSALSGSALATKAIAAVKSAQSFHVRSTGGEVVSINLRYGTSDVQGKLATQGVEVDLRGADGHLYVKGPERFWKQQLPKSAQHRALRLVRGKWVKVSSQKSIRGLDTFADRGKFATGIMSQLHAAGAKKGPHKVINGVQTVSFVDAHNHTVVYVAGHGTPYPVKVTKSSVKSAIYFSDWNSPFTAKPPPDDQVVDYSTVSH
jgi:hypothetical protein